MNAKISVLVICVETIIYLLLYNLHGCTFNLRNMNTVTKTYINFIDKFHKSMSFIT